MYEIIIGRDEDEKKDLGLTGTFLLGKHFVHMGQTTSLSNEIHMDVSKSHVVFVCGKRGSGKSYTLGVIAEGMMSLPPEITQNLSIIMLDTMGIYWTMKYDNKQDAAMLSEWKIKPVPMNVKIFTPVGYYSKFKQAGIPTDAPFSIKPSELDSTDWCSIFGVDITSPLGVVIERAIYSLKEKGADFSVKDIIAAVRADTNSDRSVRDAAENRFISAGEWGLFDSAGTTFADLAVGGQITVLDVSCYSSNSSSGGIRSLVISLVAQKLFEERMVARKEEEFSAIKQKVNYLSEKDGPQKKKLPLIWLMIDEAHEFLPLKGRTLATKALLTLLREGRQPGISLVLASQQPGKIHTDVMTQSDIVIAHRITAKLDADALGALMQSYMRQGLDKSLNELPRMKGAAIVFDDTNERMYPMMIRPRMTWHGGSAPSPISSKKKIFDF
jgi:uncharacterized protein